MEKLKKHTEDVIGSLKEEETELLLKRKKPFKEDFLEEEFEQA